MTQRTIVAAALLLPVALAMPAGAAEEGLRIFPDLELSDPASWPSSHYLQLIVLFVLLIFPVNQVVLKPLLRVLSERSTKIEGARQRASEVSQQAEAVLGRYQQAVEQAKKGAEELRKAALDAARSEQARLLAEVRQGAEAEVTRARSAIAGALADARAALRGETEALAREAAARVLGRALS